MIHDFATTPRQTDWRAEPKSAAMQTGAKKLSSTASGVAKKTLSIVLAVCVILLIAQKMVSGSDPILDQQPDQDAKREYAEALLFDEGDNQQSLGVIEVEEVTKEPLDVVVDTTIEPIKNQVAVAPVKPGVREETPVEAVDPDYEFYDSLKKGSWPVPVARGTYVDGDLANRIKPVYKLQAASFRSQSDAYRLVSKLNKRKLRAIVVESVSTSGEFWYQVSVGPFVNTSKLNKAQDILVSLGMMPLKKRVN